MPGAVYEKGYDMKKGRTKSVLTGLFAGILILGLLLGGLLSVEGIPAEAETGRSEGKSRRPGSAGGAEREQSH